MNKQAGLAISASRIKIRSTRLDDSQIVAQCERCRGPRNLGEVVVHGRVHTAQLLWGPTESGLDNLRPINLYPPFGYTQPVATFEGFFEEGSTAMFPMGLHQCGLKRGIHQIGTRHPAPIIILCPGVFANLDFKLQTNIP